MCVNILVVDDSATDRVLIKNILSEYNVFTACDGLEAMCLLEKSQDFELIILDLNMPRMDGFQFLEALKADDRYKEIRVIILTVLDELENEIKGLELGAVDYVRKPVHMQAIKVRVRIHVELQRIKNLYMQNLQDQEIAFDTVYNEAPIGIAISHNAQPADSDDMSFVKINPMFEKITGRSREELIKLGWAAITHPDDLAADLEFFKRYEVGEPVSYAMDKRYIKPDGSIVWVHMVVAPLNQSGHSKLKYIALIQDITQRKEAEEALKESERSKSVLLAHLPGMAYRCNYDRDWTMQYVSAGCLELTGYPPESLLDNRDLSFNDLITPEFRDLLWQEWQENIEHRQPFSQEYEITTADGTRKWVLEMGEGLYNANGEVEVLEGIIIDISERKGIENILKYNNEHDRWTGLYNRNYLEGLLHKDTARQVPVKRAVIGVNLSHVQALTRNYGFQYTQELIKKTVEKLNLLCSEQRQLFSTYENQLVFYLKNYKHKNELLEFCDQIATVLASLLISERVGAGIAIIEITRENASDIDQLFKNLLLTSEMALDYDDNEISVLFYNKEIEAKIIREQSIKAELEKIVLDEQGGSLYLQYQPIIELASNQICGFEALARIRSDEIGHIPPLEFIPLAEEAKLIIPVGEKIFIQALRFLSKLKERGYSGISVSINISVIELLSNNFCKNVLTMIENLAVDPGSIGLEITESVFSSDYESINCVLGELKKAGLHIAIDDFGTGYSSLARERELNINCLKIDKSFIGNLMHLDPDKAITEDIISMAHKLGHEVVAEGVEHEKQLQYLHSYGCDKIQGYLISRPLDEDAALEFLITY